MVHMKKYSNILYRSYNDYDYSFDDALYYCRVSITYMRRISLVTSHTQIDGMGPIPIFYR